MLNLWGKPHRYCDGVTRRELLRIGALGLGGVTLPSLLRAEAARKRGLGHRSVIMVYLSGGLAHQDTFDLKPNAPDGVRGEFAPIATRVPGLEVCELLPQLAQTADRYSVIRSLVGWRDEHTSFQNVTGFPMTESLRDGKPSFGSLIDHLAGPVDPVVPAFVDLFPTMQHRPYNSPGPGFLGHRHGGVKADGEDLANMRLAEPAALRLAGRRALLQGFDDLRRRLDSADWAAMDASYQRAFDVLTSARLVEALDVEREDPKVRERYGRGSPQHQGDGAPQWNDQLLVARRLVEAGVRCVTVAFGFWDTHGNNFAALRDRLPRFDQGISALVADLVERGLDRDVTLVVWGEFGRTPRINKDAGRDHWPRVNSALLAGGGMRMGQVIGATDKLAGEAAARPIHYQDVLATVYHNLGLDPQTFVRDRSGRPVRILGEHAEPIAELVS